MNTLLERTICVPVRGINERSGVPLSKKATSALYLKCETAENPLTPAGATAQGGISAQRGALYARPRLEQLARAVDAARQPRERVRVRVGREQAARLRDAAAAELAVVAQHRAQLAAAEVVPRATQRERRPRAGEEREVGRDRAAAEVRAVAKQRVAAVARVPVWKARRVWPAS